MFEGMMEKRDTGKPMHVDSWEPGNYNFMEDVPDFELQKAYLDIADEIRKYVVMDEELGFSLENIEKAKELEAKFNNWFDGRVSKLPKAYQLQIRDKFGDRAVRLIDSDITDRREIPREEPLMLMFSYLPKMADYKDLFKYEYIKSPSAEELARMKLGRVNEYWPTERLPSKEDFNSTYNDAA